MAFRGSISRSLLTTARSLRPPPSPGVRARLAPPPSAPRLPRRRFSSAPSRNLGALVGSSSSIGWCDEDGTSSHFLLVSQRESFLRVISGEKGERWLMQDAGQLNFDVLDCNMLMFLLLYQVLLWQTLVFYGLGPQQ